MRVNIFVIIEKVLKLIEETVHHHLLEVEPSFEPAEILANEVNNEIRL